MSYSGVAKEDLSIPGVEVADWCVSLLFVIYVYYTIALLHDLVSKGPWLLEMCRIVMSSCSKKSQV
jgi:hypothetical protein